jgi:hypothetical protein
MKYLIFLILLNLNCVSLKSYFQDRLNDTYDVFAFSIDRVGYGVLPLFGSKVDISIFSFGLYFGESILGCKYSKCYSNHEVNDSSQTFFIFSEEQFNDLDSAYYISRNKTSLRRNSFFTEKSSPTEYGRVRLRFGFIFGISLEFNFIEAIDFAIGFFGIDILNDDYHEFIEKNL